MILNKLLTQHPIFCFAEQFSTLCKPLLSFQITHFSHVRVSAAGGFCFLSQNPEFLKHYLKQEYYNFDAHQLTPKTTEQYLIKDMQTLTGRTKQMHQDFNEFGFGHTFTIMRAGHEFVDYYNFATNVDNESIKFQYLQLLEPLKRFIFYFHDKVNAHSCLAKAYQLPLSLDRRHGDFLTSPELLPPEKDKSFMLNDLNKIYIPGSTQYLTLREYECLAWLAKGKTQAQIAQLLNIKLRTVKAHVINVREKMQIENQFQLGMLFTKLESIYS